MARAKFHITIRKEENNSGLFVANEWIIAGRISSPSFHLTSWIVLLYTYRWYFTFCCCVTHWEQDSKQKRLLGANYSQHVLYTPFNELDWRRGHWLWLALPVIQDEPCNLPHITPVMCKSPSTSNSLLGLHWSRDKAPLKQHNSSRSVSAHHGGRSLSGGGELRAHSHNYNN